MLNLLKMGARVLLVSSFAMCLASCGDDDENYENLEPPVIEVAPNSVSGLVTAKSGEAIVGATVSMGTTTTKTDANGVYHFNNVKAGTYAMKAEAAGKLAETGELTITDIKKTQNLTWNATLVSEATKKEIVVSKTEETKGDVISEAMKDNKKAEIEVEASVPAKAIESKTENAKVIVTPLYNANTTSRTDFRASTTVTEMLIGANLSCTDTNAQLNKAITLTLQVDKSVTDIVEVRMLHNGTWVKADSKFENGNVLIAATEFTDYGLFVSMKHDIKDSTVPVVFAQDKWDNTHGGKSMKVENATYTYKVGTKIESKATDVLSALLIEKLAQLHGANSSEVKGIYPINTTLPVGTALEIFGKQNVSTASVSTKGSSVKASVYGTTTITTKTSSRHHSGGTN